MTDTTHTVWIAGATGLVGQALLQQLLDEPLEVHALLRRDGLAKHPQLHTHIVDFGADSLALVGVPAPQAVYLCLGTTIAVAGSQAAFRAVDFEAVLKVARAAKAAGARRCAVVSALAADAQSKVFYNRVKGEMEQALVALNFARLVIARPALLVGERSTLGQPRRAGEFWIERLTRPIAWLIPAKWRPIEAARVARAMALALPQPGPAVQILESDALQRLGS